MIVKANVSGIDGVQRKLRTFTNIVQGELIEKATLEGARFIRAEIARRAPRGDYPGSARKRRKYRRKPIANDIVVRLTNELIGDRIVAKIGPSRRQFHAVWIERGRSPREAREPRQKLNRRKGELTKAYRAVSRSAARPFVGPGTEASRAGAVAVFARALDRLIESTSL